MCGWALEFEFSQKQTLKQALESLYFIWEVKENTGRVGEKIKVGRKLVIYALSYQTEANWEDTRKKKKWGKHTHTPYLSQLVARSWDIYILRHVIIDSGFFPAVIKSLTCLACQVNRQSMILVARKSPEQNDFRCWKLEMSWH